MLHLTGRGSEMLRTILVGSCMSVQGLVIRTLADGRIVVRVGKETFTGRPVSSAPEVAA